ncbi:MAG: AAA family ATPase [Candidatus Limnocylindria bacterium]
MRIRSIFIDGFGIWHESRLEPDAGLTVVSGDNEAGKTTLLAFIRAILFGFETNQYPAVAGGRRGGWLDVVTADERAFRIERYGDRGGQGAVHVTGEDGVDRGAEYLSRLLHGVEASVYRNVFAFRLEELSELKGLTEGGVAARIYGAGLGTGAASALAVETGLRGEVAGLFKPGGSNPRINQLLKEIEEVERQLSGLDLPADYAAARGSLAELEVEQERLATSIDSLGSERRRLERIVAGWQPTQELRAAEAALATEPDLGAGPAGALERFTRLEAALRASQERLDDAAARLASRRERLAELHPDEPLLTRRSEVEGLLEAQAAVRGEAGALREAESHLASAERQLAETLAQLGDGWTEERVAALDLSVATRSALGGRFRDLLDGATRDVDRREIELGTAEAAVVAAAAERDALDRRLTTDAAPAAEPAPAPRVPRWVPISVGGLSLLVAALIALAGALAAGAVVAVVGLLAALSTWLVTARRGRSGEPPAARRAAVEERRGMAADRLAQASRARDGARAALEAATGARDEAATEWRGWLSAHGYDPELDRETVLSLFDAASATRATIRRRDEASGTVSRLASRRDAIGEQAATLLAELGRPTTAVDALGVELRSAVLVQEESARVEQELRKMAAEHETAAARRDQDAVGLAGLLQECGVTSEAELRENVARREKRRALEEDAARARQSLAILSGHGEAADRLLTEIEAVDDIGEVRDRLAVIRTELEAMAASRDLVLREMGALQRQIETLEASVEMSAARQHQADLVSRLEAEAEDWSVRRLAVGLMERTRQRYEREHRPGVIKTAEAFLSEWTDGRWVRIVAPLGGAIDGLERVDGKQVAIGALSRGTQEQLYLALRFGLIEHFADEAEPLPIVMDETLVNFDEARAERTARTIEQLSARHQILYFTCRGSNPLRSPAVVRLQPPTLAGAVGADLPPAVERVTA